MILLPMGLLLVGYQLIWYGYATLRQPLPCSQNNTDNCGGCCGFMDLLMPSRMKQVDDCIAKNWDAQSGNTDNTQGQFSPQTPASDSNGMAVPGTGVAPGWGIGPGGSGVGTGNAPGYNPNGKTGLF